MLSQPLSLSAFFLPLSFTPSLSHSSWFSLFVPLTHLHAVAHALISSSHSQSMEGSCLINSPRRGFPPIVVPLAGSVAACTCSRVGLPVPHLLLSCCPPGRLSGQIDRHRQTDSQSVSQSVRHRQKYSVTRRGFWSSPYERLNVGVYTVTAARPLRVL